MLQFRQIYNGAIVTISQLKMFVLKIRLYQGLIGQCQITVETHTPYACQMSENERMRLSRKNI